MSIDHSLGYQKQGLLKNSALLRLEEILKVLTKLITKNSSLIDVGCSNGYLTNLMREKFSLNYVVGIDNDEENLKIAQNLYKSISFKRINLNEPLDESLDFKVKYDIVTCFETLEHVGNLQQAIKNILWLTKTEGTLFIAVPIEIGFLGFIRLIYKIFKYGLNSPVVFKEFYGFKEFSVSNYILYLLKGDRISHFRYLKEHWSTHLGFDYRDIDVFLNKNKISYHAYNKYGTRFYIVKP